MRQAWVGLAFGALITACCSVIRLVSNLATSLTELNLVVKHYSSAEKICLCHIGHEGSIQDGSQDPSFSLAAGIMGRSGLLSVHIWGPTAAPKAEGWELRLLGELGRKQREKMDKNRGVAQVMSKYDSDIRRE